MGKLLIFDRVAALVLFLVLLGAVAMHQHDKAINNPNLSTNLEMYRTGVRVAITTMQGLAPFEDPDFSGKTEAQLVEHLTEDYVRLRDSLPRKERPGLEWLHGEIVWAIRSWPNQDEFETRCQKASALLNRQTTKAQVDLASRDGE